MSIYQPKRKTSSGVEEVTFPISSVDGLGEKIEGKTLEMPRIRMGSITDLEATMKPSETNPIIFTVEIIDGKLEVGDKVQICSRQLYTYDEGRRRKHRLRRLWETVIDGENVNNRFIFVSVYRTDSKVDGRMFKNGGYTKFGTLSPLYIRVKRPILQDGKEVDAKFSNIVTVWKRYATTTGKVQIK